MSIAPVWECQRSVEAEVPVSFAWAYMTDISNWNDPPAEFALEGPFVTIEGDFFLERAVLLVHRRFDPLSERTARLTQRMELRGENAAAYVDEIQSLFEPNMEPGLRRIAQRMEAGHTVEVR